MRHSMAWPVNRDFRIARSQGGLAGRDAYLLAHQIDTADHLGDGMLDLQTSIHLDEGELAVLVEKL